MPRSPFGWALTIAVPVLVVGFGFVVVGGGTTGSGNTGPSVQVQISAVCNEALREAREVNHSPRTITEGLEVDRRGLAIHSREITQLEALAPGMGASFSAGLADEHSLLAGLSRMMARPDYVKLSLTLPRHPSLAPSWVLKWRAREGALVTDARDQFSRAGIPPACKKSLG